MKDKTECVETTIDEKGNGAWEGRARTTSPSAAAWAGAAAAWASAMAIFTPFKAPESERGGESEWGREQRRALGDRRKGRGSLHSSPPRLSPPNGTRDSSTICCVIFHFIPARCPSTSLPGPRLPLPLLSNCSMAICVSSFSYPRFFFGPCDPRSIQALFRLFSGLEERQLKPKR